VSKAKTVVVMADTHADSLDELPTKLITAVKQADYVIHLGDFTSLGILRELKQISNFYGIWGNHDRSFLRRELKRVEEVEIAGKKFGLIHGLINPIAGRVRMKRSFRKNGNRLHAILYGHTHIPTMKYDNNVFFFNPGSVAGKFPAAVKSFGRLTIDGTIKGEIVILENRNTLGPSMYIPSVIIRNILRTAEALL